MSLPQIPKAPRQAVLYTDVSPLPPPMGCLNCQHFVAGNQKDAMKTWTQAGINQCKVVDVMPKPTGWCTLDLPKPPPGMPNPLGATRWDPATIKANIF